MANSSKKRFSPEERYRMIVDGAKAFFAEFGFDASTHQLASHLGVTQPLIYQYFPTKENLIDAVYEEVFEQRWEGDWNRILDDRKRPLGQRLEDFYKQYCAIVHSPEWARIYLFAGLRSKEINQRYNPMVEKRIIQKICNELRVHSGLPELKVLPATPRELEVIWTVHGGIFYYGVRRGIYEVAVNADLTEKISGSIALLLSCYPSIAPKQ